MKGADQKPLILAKKDREVGFENTYYFVVLLLTETPRQFSKK
jgi:hypothetical protein